MKAVLDAEDGLAFKKSRCESLVLSSVRPVPGDMLMMLDDDHAYVPDAVGRAPFS